MRTLKKFGYWSPESKPIRRSVRIIAAHMGDYQKKKQEITRAALEQMYETPSIREPPKVTVRQRRLKMILNEALDIAHSLCEHGDETQCRLAWEMVDEIDDAATRAGVRYQ
jgi:hypothetical protein